MHMRSIAVQSIHVREDNIRMVGIYARLFRVLLFVVPALFAGAVLDVAPPAIDALPPRRALVETF